MNTVTSLSAAVATLDVVTEGLKTAFLQPISNTMHSLLTAAQTCQAVKRNHDDCAQMLEQVHELLLKLKQKLEIHKALQFLGDVYLADGDQQTATSLWAVALEGFTKMDVHRSRAECMLRLGDIAEVNEDLSKAGELWNTARPLFERSSQVKQVGYVDERIARVRNHPEPMVQLLALDALKTCPDTVIVEEEDEIKPSLIPA
ncbi:hypothetical protein FB451DRAFT_1163935 [Mycena latifolia]|nr:hypothetical protein FB451DRAFT_1163935 [Mycena latifolia]